MSKLDNGERDGKRNSCRKKKIENSSFSMPFLNSDCWWIAKTNDE